MPPDTLTAPPAPAAAAAPAAEPIAPPAAPPPPAQPSSKELANKLFGLLTAPTADLTDPPKKPDPEPAKPAVTEPPKPKAEEKPIKVKPKAAVETEKPPPVPKKSDLTPTPPAAPPAAPKPEDAADFEKTLYDEERLQLEDAREAEKRLGDKYRGHGNKMLTFLKEHAKKAVLVSKGDMDEAELREWAQANEPKITPLDMRRLERLRVTEDVKKEFEPKLEEERHTRWAESESPKIKAKGTEVYNKLSNTALPDDVMAAIAERTKGITDRGEFVKKVQEVQKDYALEFEVAEGVFNQAANDIEEFHRLTTINPATNKPVVEFDPKNPQHNQVVSMLTNICLNFKATGGAELKRDGKWFVTREEWQAMDPSQRAPFWTFDNAEVVERAVKAVKDVVKLGVKQKLDYLEGRGFKRVIAAPVAPAPAALPPSSSGSPAAPRPAPPPPAGAPPPPSIGAALASKLNSQPVES